MLHTATGEQPFFLEYVKKCEKVWAEYGKTIWTDNFNQQLVAVTAPKVMES